MMNIIKKKKLKIVKKKKKKKIKNCQKKKKNINRKEFHLFLFYSLKKN